MAGMWEAVKELQQRLDALEARVKEGGASVPPPAPTSRHSKKAKGDHE